MLVDATQPLTEQDLRVLSMVIEAGRALAFLRGRDYVLPADVVDLAPDVLRHRVVPSYEALAEGMTADALLRDIMRGVPAPEKVLETHARAANA